MSIPEESMVWVGVRIFDFKDKGEKHHKCHCLQGAYEKTFRVDMEGRRFTTGKEYLREMSADECLSWQFTQVWEGM